MNQSEDWGRSSPICGYIGGEWHQQADSAPTFTFFRTFQINALSGSAKFQLDEMLRDVTHSPENLPLQPQRSLLQSAACRDNQSVQVGLLPNAGLQIPTSVVPRSGPQGGLSPCRRR